MYGKKAVVTVTTDADGNATAYSEVLNGRVVNVKYTKTDFANGVDFTITCENSGVSLWTDTNIDSAETVAPVQIANVGTTGAASTISESPIVLVDERVKIVIASGGAVKTGTFTIILG